MITQHTKHHTAERDRIPVSHKIAFGFGMAVPIAFVNSLAQMTNLIFNLELKVSVVWIGIALMIPRLWDAVTDPIAGYLSDNARTRWGRRRPFVVVGGCLVAVTYVLIWWVPREWGPAALIGYYLGVSLMFYTAATLYSVPLVALGYEMSDDYHEKTRLFGYGSFFGNIFAIATPWMYGLASLPMFENQADGMRIVSLGVGVVILFTTVWPGLVCQEGEAPARIERSERIPFWTGIRSTLKNRDFMIIVAVVFCITAGFNLVNNFANYITIFYLYGGDKTAASAMLGINGSVWAVSALLTVFPMIWSSQRLGKALTMRIFVGVMAIGCFAKIICYDPQRPWLMVIPTLFLASGMLVLYTMAGAMIADVCNADEVESGVRREGGFSAVYSWWLKVAVSFGYLVSGFLMHSTGFDVEQMVQRESTLLWMRIWEIGVPGGLLVVGFFLLRGYSLTEDKVYEFKEVLEANRARNYANEESTV